MLSQTKKGISSSMASLGLTIVMGSIFVLGIGIPITNTVIDDNNLTGLSATVISFSPVVIAAVYLFMVTNVAGIIKK